MTPRDYWWLISALTIVMVVATISNYRLREANTRLAKAEQVADFLGQTLESSWAEGKVTYEFWYCDGVAVKARSTQPDPRTPGAEIVLTIDRKDCASLSRLIEEFKKKKEAKP